MVGRVALMVLLGGIAPGCGGTQDAAPAESAAIRSEPAPADAPAAPPGAAEPEDAAVAPAADEAELAADEPEAAVEPPRMETPAGPLTREQIQAAVEAARNRLPPVDKAAAEACAENPMNTAEEQAAAASCFRAAGSLGMAIRLWTRIIQTAPSSAEARQAYAELGPAYEQAGMFRRAADTQLEYARRYAADQAARDQLIRAVCAYRQLGDETNAVRAARHLRRMYRSASPDDDSLCENFRPIAVPAN